MIIFCEAIFFLINCLVVDIDIVARSSYNFKFEEIKFELKILNWWKICTVNYAHKHILYI